MAKGMGVTAPLVAPTVYGSSGREWFMGSLRVVQGQKGLSRRGAFVLGASCVVDVTLFVCLLFLPPPSNTSMPGGTG